SLNLATAVEDTTADQLRLVAQPIFGFPELGRQVREGATADLLQFDPLEQIPDPLIGVHLWCVGWQLRQQESLGGPAGQEGFDLAFPDGWASPPKSPKSCPGSGARLRRKNRTTSSAPEVWSCLCLSRRPSGVMPLLPERLITRQLHAQHRRLPDRGGGAPRPRQQIKARLIYPDEGSLFLGGLFLSAGHTSVCQAAIACSSRWVARSMGCWTRHSDRA